MACAPIGGVWTGPEAARRSSTLDSSVGTFLLTRTSYKVMLRKGGEGRGGGGGVCTTHMDPQSGFPQRISTEIS